MEYLTENSQLFIDAKLGGARVYVSRRYMRMNTSFFIVATGVLGIGMLSVSAIPQLVRCFRHGTQGLSYWASIVVGVVDLSWFMWGVFSGVVALMVADGLGSAMSLIILGVVVKDQHKNPVLTVFLVVVSVTLLILVGLWQPAAPGFIAAGLSLGWRTLQLQKIVASPNISGVSAYMWFLNGVALGVWALHGALVGKTFLMLSCSVLGTYAIIIMVVVLLKRRSQRLVALKCEDV